MDQKVLDAQVWLNNNYTGKNGYTPIQESGTTGTATFMALVKAFQIELNLRNPGVVEVTGVFGDVTLEASPTLSEGNANVFVTILQHGLFCKGYNVVSVSGTFDGNTKNKVRSIQEHAGLKQEDISSDATPLVIQAILSTEYYEKVSRGNSKVREIQQALNREYFREIGIQPCDGIYGRNTNKTMIKILQLEEGMPASDTTGSFGVNTKRCCPDIPYNNIQTDYTYNIYTMNRIKRFIKLFKYCLYCYGVTEYKYIPILGFAESRYDPGELNDEFNSDTISALNRFQEAVALPVRNKVTLDEWMGVLVSTGNPERNGQAADCASRITENRANALKSAGYSIVGRYLTGSILADGGRVSKNLTRPEMKTIFDSGLNLFVIYQDAREFYVQNPDENSIENYFNYDQGYNDAEKAFAVAKSLGVPRNEFIYFAVDYDFMEYQTESMIKPYFHGVKAYADITGNIFRIGIYAPRNICTQVREEGYSESSFVCDMSTGFSGNMAFHLPDDWAFDQIKEYTLNTTGYDFGYKVDIGPFAIDKDVVSGRYTGFNKFESRYDNEFDLISETGRPLVYLGTDPIPVYWAKLIDGNGNFYTKYPTYNYIKPDSIFSLRERKDNQNPSIRYVYFRDETGRLNAGYINSEDTSGRFVPFEKCEAVFSYDGDTVQLSERGYPHDDDEYYEFMVWNTPLRVITYGGTTRVTLEPGAKVRIPRNAKTGATFPHYIQATDYKEYGSDKWEYTSPEDIECGYIELGFDYGVLPEDRKFISRINNPEVLPVMEIENCNYPITLTKGEAFTIRGIIKSNYILTYVSIDVRSTDNLYGDPIFRQYVYPSGVTINDGKLTYDINQLDSYFKFNELDVGTYVFSVFAKNYNNLSGETLVYEEFTVVDTPPSSLTIAANAAVPPNTLTKGSGATINGLITSNYNILSVKAGVYTPSGENTPATEKTVTVNAKSYNVSGLDPYILFNYLDYGTYVYKVVATDEKQTKTLVEKTFTVVEASSTLAIAANASVPPNTLTKGKGATINGLITSNYKILSVTAGVYTPSGGSTPATERTVTPNTTSYNVSGLDPYILFNYLDYGTYVYRAVASDEKLTKTLIEKSFTVV